MSEFVCWEKVEAILKYKVKVFLKCEISEQNCSAKVEILSVIKKEKFKFGHLQLQKWL